LLCSVTNVVVYNSRNMDRAVKTVWRMVWSRSSMALVKMLHEGVEVSMQVGCIIKRN